MTTKTLAALMLSATVAMPAMAEDTIKIAYIDPLSGPFGNTGDAGIKHFRFAADEINANGGMAGMQVEIIGLDNKLSPKESLVQLQKAIDQGAKIIAQGNGSSAANALTDAIAKHNKRNPGEEVLFLNYAAVDPALTNDKCNFWHFRFDSHVDMKMAALTDWLKDQDDLKNVYILGQDYSFGKAVAAAANKMVKEKRPDMSIVGDELHPIGRVKDFTPYVQKMMAAETDVVITGNWGTDMTLLIKAAADAGHDAPYLTFYGGGLGAPTAMGQSAVGKVKQITEFHENLEATDGQIARLQAFEDEFGGLDYYYQRVFNAMNMFDDAIEEVGGWDPVAVATALEGRTLETPYGTITMRAEDHQIIQPLVLSTFSDDVERGVEGMDLGFKTDVVIPAEATAVDTTCKMRRP